MRKLKFKLNRNSLQIIITTFIRPLLEYGDIIWDNCTQFEKQDIEKIQIEAARNATGTIKLVSLNTLYQDTGWVTLEKRRENHNITKTCLFKYTEKFSTKKWNFSDKNSDIFNISAQNIDCGYPLEPPRRGGSNGYPQSMFLSWNKKNNVYPCQPQFYYIKVGFKGVKII